MTPAEVRALCRANRPVGATAGLAPGFVQANLMVVPADWAFEFLLFCQRNPKPCPIVDVLEPGLVSSGLAADSDVRTDLPAYRIWREGRLIAECADVASVWRDDLVSFLIGCSFTFEAALIEAGIALPHVTQRKNVAMYRTNLACVRAGRLHGPMVVSMRPIASRDVVRAVEISARYPDVHGAPVHIGDPAALGIDDLGRPDYGDAVDIEAHEIPVFWACGVTPQSIAVSSRIPFCITHAPGQMFLTDAPMMRR